MNFSQALFAWYILFLWKNCAYETIPSLEKWEDFLVNQANGFPSVIAGSNYLVLLFLTTPILKSLSQNQVYFAWFIEQKISLFFLYKSKRLQSLVTDSPTSFLLSFGTTVPITPSYHQFAIWSHFREQKTI